MAMLLPFAPKIEKFIHHHPIRIDKEIEEKLRKKYETAYDQETARPHPELDEVKRKKRISQRLENRDATISQKVENQIRVKIKNKFYKQTQQILIKNDPEFGKLSEKAKRERIIDELKKHDLENMSYDEILKIASSISYQRANEKPEFAKICIQAGLSEENFDHCLDIYNNRKKSDQLPALFIDGTNIAQSEYYFAKLPIDDPRGLLLGFYTHCCQSIGNHAEQVAIHGMESEYGGFYVIMKKKSQETCDIENDKIVAQSWAWLSQEGNLVFDSLEVLQPSKAEDFLKFYYLAAEQALGYGWTEKMINEQANESVDIHRQIQKVTLGQGGGTPDTIKSESANPPEEPIGDRLYNDSCQQYLLAKKR